MTREEGCHSEARLSPLSVILRSGLPSLSVILRSAATKNLSYHVFEPGEKILRFAQNDKRGNAVILRCGSTPLCHSEERLSLSLCHSEARSDEESFLPCL